MKLKNARIIDFENKIGPGPSDHVRFIPGWKQNVLGVVSGIGYTKFTLTLYWMFSDQGNCIFCVLGVLSALGKTMLSVYLCIRCAFRSM